MNGPYALSILVISLCVFNFVSGCLEEKDGEIIKMTFEEFINDYHTDYVNTSGNTSRQFRGWYSTLNAGDTVVIEDTLQKMVYDDIYGITTVEFSSIEGRTVQFQVEGDLWNKFQEGDNVTLTLYIIHVSYTQQISPSETISIDKEIYEEGWDSVNNHEIPVPQQFIQPA
jgi:hypothetical protein